MNTKINNKLILSVILLVFSIKSLSAFELIKSTIGAEATALGGAMAATVNDPSAIYWNPAGLANINGKNKQKSKTNLSSEADQKFSSDSFDKLFEDSEKRLDKTDEIAPQNSSSPFEIQLFTTYGYMTFDRHIFMASTAMTLFKGTFGLGLLGTYVPFIDGYNTLGVSTGTISYGSYAGYLGYGWESGMVKMGVSLSAYQEALYTKNYFGGALNMGMQITPIPILHIGVAMQNLPGGMQYSPSNPSLIRRVDTVMKMTLGISTPPPDASLMLLLGVDANLDQIAQQEVYGNIGLQVKFAKYFALMAGYKYNSFALGFGFNLPFIKISYAINQDPLHTGFQHFVDLNLAF
ncbi:MAG: hypothetical protein OEV78_07990 [Spirochaetia bacterium]|nr:hypothetical protein [Spirochaetia bacterium]